MGRKKEEKECNNEGSIYSAKQSTIRVRWGKGQCDNGRTEEGRDGNKSIDSATVLFSSTVIYIDLLNRRRPCSSLGAERRRAARMDVYLQ